jgi:UDP-N-acetylmuramate dehydrogenase
MDTILELKHYTYMKTGGIADEIITVTSQTEMIEAVKNCRHRAKRYFVLGSGSNTLFSDTGFRGVVILNRMKSFSVDANTHQLTAESGCPMNMLVNHVANLGLSGLEWYLGLPGTLGGAIFNNSHFKEHLIAEVIDTVTILTETNQVTTLKADQLEAAYDYSRFQHTKDIILSAVINLIPDDPEAVMSRAKQAMAFRSSHQPLSEPSSGSFFKNPTNAPTAGALIDQAGLKNTQVGGAMVSPKHANFIVNTGSATTTDIQTLAQKIQSTVKQQFNVDLQKEVFLINEFGERI